MLQFIAINTNQEHWTKSPAIISRKKTRSRQKSTLKIWPRLHVMTLTVIIKICANKITASLPVSLLNSHRYHIVQLHSGNSAKAQYNPSPTSPAILHTHFLNGSPEIICREKTLYSPFHIACALYREYLFITNISRHKHAYI